MSINGLLNSEGQNFGKISGKYISIDVAGNLTKSLTANGSLLLTNTTPALVPLPASMFYGLTAGTGNSTSTDYAATVAVHTSTGSGRVPFPRDGPLNAYISRNDANSFILANIGTYEVNFKVHTTEPGQLQLELQGQAIPESLAVNMNPTSGGHPIVGSCLIKTLAVNQVLAVINPAGNAVALTITPADGSDTHACAQSIVIKQIA